MLAKNPVRWMAPALPVFAAKAAPTGAVQDPKVASVCGSGFTREGCYAVAGIASVQEASACERWQAGIS